MAQGAQRFLVRAVPTLEILDIIYWPREDRKHPHVPKCLSQVQQRVLERVTKEEFHFFESLKVK